MGSLEVADPDCDELVLERVRLQAAKGDDAAADTFAHYTTLKARDAKRCAYLARFLLSHGADQRTDVAASLAMDCDPDDPVAMALQEQLLDMEGHAQEGIKLQEQAVHLSAADAEAKFQLGSIHDQIKHREQAVQEFTEAASINPTDARAWDYLELDLESH